jgi:hypothetical protein
MSREHRPITVTNTSRRLTRAQRKKVAEMICRGTEAWHVKADGTKELLKGAVVMPRAPIKGHSTFTTSKTARPSKTIDLDTYKARAWALRVRQKSRGR